MTKAECFLLFMMVCVIGFLGVSINHDRCVHSELRYEVNQVHNALVKLEEEKLVIDERQDSLIGAIIRTEAMRGTFDKEK